MMLINQICLKHFQTHKQPVIDYEAIREKAAAQKKDMERALTKFLAKTSQTHNLFESDEVIFPCTSFFVVLFVL